MTQLLRALSLLAIYPLILMVNLSVGPILAPLPLPLRALVTSALLVPLMTWVVMPRITRLFYGWLYPRRR